MRDSAPAKIMRASLASAGSAHSSSRAARHASARVQRGTAEPPAVALLKRVFNPSVIVITLLWCAVAYGQQLNTSYLALAVLTFLITSQLVSEPILDHSLERDLSAIVRHRIFGEWLVVSAVLLFLAFAFKTTEIFSRKVILTWFAVTPFAVVGAQLGLRKLAAFYALRGGIVQSHVIIGANECGMRLAHRLKANPHLGTFKGFFDDRQDDRSDDVPTEQLLGRMEDVLDYVRLNSVSNVYICLPIRAEDRVTRLMRELRDTTASVYFVPDVFVFDLIRGQLADVDGVPVLAICETPFSGMNGVTKRFSDIVFSALLILLLWPVMLAIASVVKLSSPGPVIFKQRRYGLYGERIRVYKFRTMTVCEDRDQVTQARRDDPRVTKFGSFLRRTSLDELPQLFNVLFGSMSLVGPRPHAVTHNEEYRKLIDGYMLRHKVRPGITGWAQVNGFRGETETLDKMKRRVEFDLHYLRNWSLALDITILLRTARLVVRDGNAY
jgi:putative colanic acid biosynthesis UDP-glucose lipid carrier transferase